MAIFMSDKRTKTGGRAPKPAVFLTCGSYEETVRLAQACKRAELEITWTLPDLEREEDWGHATRLRIEGRCRTDKMEELRVLVEELYERADPIVEIPDQYYQALLYLHRQEVWRLCFEGGAKERKIALKFLDSKKKWLLTQILGMKYPITSAGAHLTSESSDETYEDLKNLIETIENLDLGHCSRVKGRISRKIRLQQETQERIDGEALG